MEKIRTALRVPAALMAVVFSGTLSADVISSDSAGVRLASERADQVAPSPEAAPEAVAEDESGVGDLLDMPIEQVRRTSVAPALEMEVSTVSRQESTIGRSPAAVFVITPEMIRRSGATSIPEVLRMVPGLDVARITPSRWAVSARGFNGRFGKKLLVQIDGRSVYSPRNSGVRWAVRDVVLEDVERIEVIRGPGASMWGANAVNGVISIITKKAGDSVCRTTPIDLDPHGV